MTFPDRKGDSPPTVLQAQVNLILNGVQGGDGGLPDAAVEWGGPARDRVNYLYRARSLLVRDADVERVRAKVPSIPVEGDENVRGLTLLAFAPEETGTVEQVCARLDRELGEGVATPDHIFYVCPDTICPATEPEEVPQDAAPYPPVSTDPCDGTGVMVAVLDTGWLPGADSHEWLSGVKGDPENPLSVNSGIILPYEGHGTFVAGVVRTMAPKADVWVGRTFVKFGATFESFLVKKMSEALKKGAEVISMDFGTNTRKDIPSLGFEIVKQQLEHHPSVVLVAAAGNNSSRRPFWPAAYHWTVSVGALSANWRTRAYFTDYGSWVDVYAPGEDLVNAFADGTYICDEPPNTGQSRTFKGMCRWSGTSFATPIMSGLIAARISGTGENGPQAAQALLAIARAQARPGVGPVILPGQACCDLTTDARSGGCGCGCGQREHRRCGGGCSV